jgi:hypothetical protein
VCLAFPTPRMIFRVTVIDGAMQIQMLPFSVDFWRTINWNSSSMASRIAMASSPKSPSIA